ncbi:zinc ribbon domain-containing protein [Thalassobacillus pellis]|uniref:zinc ribbon domain-containing protein n=1 Tax=Thalassobacillus pellis TaxID=748008 RepID=UPI00195F2D76|nr:zinc ribbon domain-containing protein [Thalassobacillus pellis]MBM7551678.1 hypothetical protein [Thalassobacillus pellis]
MTCPKCNAAHDGGKFCGNCGSPVEGNVAHTQSAGEAAATAAPMYDSETTFEKLKQSSQNYMGYFLDGLKNPTKKSHNTSPNDFVNGTITLVLYALLFAAIGYTASSKVMMYFDVPFLSIFFPIFMYTAILLVIMTALVFGLSKPGNSQLTFKGALSRFGTFMILPAAFLLVGFVFLLLNVFSLFAITTGLAVLTMFVALTFSIYSYKREDTPGLDALYSSLIAYVVLLVVLQAIAENAVFGDLLETIETFSNF